MSSASASSSSRSGPLVAVLGSTGNQGGSVVRSLLKSSKNYRVVAVTRKVDSDAAKALTAQGASVVYGDVKDKKSLINAFAGAWAVYGMTITDELFVKDPSGPTLYEQGKILVDAAEEAKVEYFLWSSLFDLTAISNNKFDLPHFTVKAQVDAYARSRKALKVVSMVAPGFYENLLNVPPRPTDDGKGFSFGYSCRGDALVPYFSAAEDTGSYVVSVLDDAASYSGKTVTMVGEYITYNGMAKAFSTVFGKTVSYHDLPDEVFKSFLPLSVAKPIADMYRCFGEFGYGAPSGEDSSRGTKFEAWLRKQKDNPKFAALAK